MQSSQSSSKNRRLGLPNILIVLAIMLAGPGIGLLLSGFGIVLAPPRTPFTGLLYVPLAFLGLPILIAAVAAKLLRGWMILVALACMAVAALFYLALVGAQLPGGMTQCEPIAAPPPQVRYACVSTSSDADFHLEFTLEGRAGWPVMRMVDQE